MNAQAVSLSQPIAQNGSGSANNESLIRKLEAQRALLSLSINHSQFPDSEALFKEASALAAEMTNADVAFLLLRARVTLSSASERGYRQVSRLRRTQEPGTSSSRPAPDQFIEAASDKQRIVRTPEGRHLLIPFGRPGKVMAILDLYLSREHSFDSVDVQTMDDLRLLVNSILQNHYLVTARTALVELAQTLSAELDLSLLLEKVAEAAAKIAYAQASSILLIQPGEENMRFAAVYGLDETDREGMRRIVVPLQGSMAGSVALTGKPLVSNQVDDDPRFFAGVSNTVSTKTRSLLAVPMVAGDQPIGALEVINQNYNDGFDQGDVEILTLFASQAAVAIQNARLLAERQASLAELTKLEQRKSQFIALASHELRTPLNLVSGYAMLLRATLEEGAEPCEPETIDYLEQIEQATTRLTGMVNNITSMYNLETGRTQLLLQRKDVVDVIKAVTSEYTEWCRKKGIDLRILTTEPHYAICDPIEVNRILGNLINNAVKFTPEGGKITIAVDEAPALNGALYASADAKKEFIVTVADTGPGIDPVQLESIFERFSQIGSHLNRVQGGIGLGLPLTKALVEKHGGRLWVDSKPDQGAVFHFTLPAAR